MTYTGPTEGLELRTDSNGKVWGLSTPAAREAARLEAWQQEQEEAQDAERDAE